MAIEDYQANPASILHHPLAFQSREDAIKEVMKDVNRPIPLCLCCYIIRLDVRLCYS